MVWAVPQATTGAVLRDARRRAALTQVALAERAGVQQSVISAYENDRREPSLATLQRLVEATGQRLDVVVVPDDGVRCLDGPTGRLLQRRRSAVHRIARRHGVAVLGVFGSVARGEENEGSDVDLLVDLPAGAGFFTLFRLQDDLERELGRRVDVVPRAGLKPAVREQAERDLVVL